MVRVWELQGESEVYMVDLVLGGRGKVFGAIGTIEAPGFLVSGGCVAAGWREGAGWGGGGWQIRVV